MIFRAWHIYKTENMRVDGKVVSVWQVPTHVFEWTEGHCEQQLYLDIIAG